ncbi:MAG: 3-oxoacid CoA-transferase subunit B [Oscillospiraceae bacterium]|nr:3-oxoacid CoA-transferase subunit B [Oscillospiraceae bacterium]
MAELTKKELIAKRIAMFFNDGELANLGVGIPTMVPAFLPEGVEVWLEAENGIIGGGAPAAPDAIDPFFKDAGDKFCTILPGGCCFNSAMSFGLIRGGHLAYTVLGAMQVDQAGNLANWVVPGGKMAGMGGAMDLVAGAKKVIVATEHCSKDGKPKILKKCSFPLTGEKVVDHIVTELAVIDVTPEGLVLREVAPGVTADEVIAKTEAPLTVAADLRTMPV